jgi:hypothetical protein
MNEITINWILFYIFLAVLIAHAIKKAKGLKDKNTKIYEKEKQKRLIQEIMKADQDDGLYEM